jgi:serine/threonine protein kinase/tetratricopeptide (TPR) repeat protein
MPDSAPRPSADRNLLFGILALQMDFITRDALIGAMHAWVLDKAKPLGLILFEQGALRDDTHALLSALVEKHLELHGDDPEQSLAAVSSVGSVREQLARLADPDLDASLAQVSAARQDETVDEAPRVPSTMGGLTSAGLRFRIVRPHAKGGLGEVYVAHDEELHREVALKEIQQRHAHDAHSRARFLLEAEITGGLEHPGIVPVYGLGQYADGRPFYAMRFIKGDSLKDAISRFHKPENQERPAGEQAVAFRKLLGRFIDVCNAIAYAHSRGVLHRDLKPGNIMLGKYGETLVVDWGLAKVRGQGSKARSQESATEEGPLQPAAASGSAETEAGQAMGTPPYMSPEQAAGWLDLLGPASDVYSLGATLYCLLTGRPPFERRDDGAILQKVQRGEFPKPGQVKPGVPRPLEAICQKAMARERQNRYASPRSLADDIEHWLADEPVSAWPEPWTVKTRRWVGRHRVQVTAAAAALLVLILGGFGAGLWYVNDRAYREAELASRQQQVNRETTAGLDEAEKLLTDLRARLDDPGKVHVLLSGIDEWKGIVDGAGHAMRRARAVAAGQEALLDAGPARRLQVLAGQLRQEEEAFALAKELDDIRLEGSTLVEGKWDPWRAAKKYPTLFATAGLEVERGDLTEVSGRIARSPARWALVAAVDHWANVTPDYKLLARLLQLARHADPHPWRDRFRDFKVWNDLKELERLGKDLRPEEQSPQMLVALALRLRANGANGPEVLRRGLLHHVRDFWLFFHLGLYAKDAVERIGCCQAALALRPQSSPALNNLGTVLHAKKDLDGAITAYRKAIQIAPNFAWAHYNLGIALHDKKDLDGAITAFRKAIQVNDNFAKANLNLGKVLDANNDLQGAIAAYRRAIQINPNYAKAYNNLGIALRRSKDLEGAISAYRKAIQLDPNFTLTYYNLGMALRANKDLEGAIRALRTFIQLDPNDVDGQYDLGNALRDNKDQEGAASAFRKAIELDPNHARAHCNLGLVYLRQGRFAEAQPFLQQGHALGSRRANWRYPSGEWIKTCQQLLSLDRKLGAFLDRGEAPAGMEDRLALADLCRRYKHYHACAVPLYAGLFGTQAALADDLAKAHRYQAACSALLAAGAKDSTPRNPMPRRKPNSVPRPWSGCGQTFTSSPRISEPVRPRGLGCCSTGCPAGTRRRRWRACAVRKRWPGCLARSKKPGTCSGRTGISSCNKSAPPSPKRVWREP